MRYIDVKITDKNGVGDSIGGYIRFRITKTAFLFSNKASVNLFNISDITMAEITKENRRIFVTGGYEDNSGLLFAGKIDRVVPLGSSGSDVQTRVEASDAESMLLSHAQIELLKGESRKKAIERILSENTNGESVRVGPINIDDSIKVKGQSLYTGTVYDVLMSLLMPGEYASIQDNQFVVVKEDKTEGRAVLLTSDTGLMPGVVVEGDKVRFKSVLNPKIRPNALVQIQSKKVESVNIGPYKQPDNTILVKVIKCEYSGDNRLGEHSVISEGRVFYGAFPRS